MEEFDAVAEKDQDILACIERVRSKCADPNENRNRFGVVGEK